MIKLKEKVVNKFFGNFKSFKEQKIHQFHQICSNVELKKQEITAL